MSHLGLLGRETAVLRSMFELSDDLSRSFELLEPEKAPSCDIVIVNADSRIALRWWGDCRKSNPLSVPLLLSARALPPSKIVSVRRPLKLDALEAAFRKITTVELPEDAESLDSPLRVLVVDDSYPVRQFMLHKLKQMLGPDVEIAFAERGEQAMEQIWQAPFDLVFLDVVMPGIDGYKVCKAIKREQFAYVVMLSSKKSPFDKVRGTMSGCDAYLAKPPDEARLREVLDQALSEKKVRDCGGRTADSSDASQDSTTSAASH